MWTKSTCTVLLEAGTHTHPGMGAGTAKAGDETFKWHTHTHEKSVVATATVINDVAVCYIQGRPSVQYRQRTHGPAELTMTLVS